MSIEGSVVVKGKYTAYFFINSRKCEICKSKNIKCMSCGKEFDNGICKKITFNSDTNTYYVHYCQNCWNDNHTNNIMEKEVD